MVELLPSKQVVVGSSPISRSTDRKTGGSRRGAPVFLELRCRGCPIPSAKAGFHHSGLRPRDIIGGGGPFCNQYDGDVMLT